MRFTTCLVLSAVCLASLSFTADVLAADKAKKEKKQAEPQVSPMAAVAKEIFAANDRNHDGSMSSHEFARANGALGEKLTEWAQSGQFHKAAQELNKKANAAAKNAKGKDAAEGPVATAFNPADLSHKRSVSEPEWTIYSQTMFQQAMTEARYEAAAAAQLQAQIKAYRAQHPRGRRR